MVTYNTVYRGSPHFTALAKVLMKAYFAPSTSAMVAGNASNELAKIGGITPPELTRSGR